MRKIVFLFLASKQTNECDHCELSYNREIIGIKNSFMIYGIYTSLLSKMKLKNNIANRNVSLIVLTLSLLPNYITTNKSLRVY